MPRARSAPPTASATRPPRGRPAARFFSLGEVSELLSIPSDRIHCALELAPADLFPGAYRSPSQGWQIPATALRGLLGEELPRLYRVAEFAAIIGFSRAHVHGLVACGAIPSRRILGQVRIPASAYWTLPEARPSGAAFSFSGSQEVSQFDD